MTISPFSSPLSRRSGWSSWALLGAALATQTPSRHGRKRGVAWSPTLAIYQASRDLQRAPVQAACEAKQRREDG